MSLHEVRLKSDFQYYCEQQLHIPFEDTKFIITESHLRAINTVMDNPFSVAKAYRWWGKSKLLTFCFTMWRAEMWNESAVILSANEDLAFQKLDDIRSSCEFDNDKLGYMSGKGVDGITWNRWEIWLVDRSRYVTNENGQKSYKIKAKIYAKGIFSNFRWIHVHNIIGDDIVVEDNSQTPDQREQLKKRFFAAALGMRLSRNKTHVIVIWTPQHPDDLLESLCEEKNDMWAKFVHPVLNPSGMPSTPELHDMQWIDEQKKLVWPVIFAQEYMLQPMTVWQDFFGEYLFEDAKDRTINMDLEYKKNPNEIIVLWTDFAVKDNKREAEQKDTDYFALAVISYNMKTGKRKIINLYRDRWVRKTEQLALVRIFDIKYDVDKIAMEWFVFLEWAKQDLAEDLWHKIVDTSTFKGKKDLKDGIPSLQFEFEKKQYIVPYWDVYSQTMANIFFSELKNFQTTKHDDVADSVLRAERAIREIEGHTMTFDKNFALYGQDRLKRDTPDQIRISSQNPNHAR